MNRLQRAISVHGMCIEDIGETPADSFERVFSVALPIGTDWEDRYSLGVCCGDDLQNAAEGRSCYLSNPPKAKAILSKLLRNGNATGR